MNALALRRGDHFVEMSPDDWEIATRRERTKIKKFRAESDTTPCRMSPERVHIRTSAGSWCIPGLADVTLTNVEAVHETAKKAS